MIVQVYTDDNDRMEWTVDLPETDVLFLEDIERRFGELSSARGLNAEESIRLDTLCELIQTLPSVDTKIPRICMYR